VGESEFSRLQNVQTGFGVHYSMGTGVLSPGVKRPGREISYLPSSSTGFNVTLPGSQPVRHSNHLSHRVSTSAFVRLSDRWRADDDVTRSGASAKDTPCPILTPPSSLRTSMEKTHTNNVLHLIAHP